MTFMDKVYTLRTEVWSDGKNVVFYQLLQTGRGNFVIWKYRKRSIIKFRQMERKNRNLQQSDWRHQEASVWDEMLYNGAFRVPKSVQELIFDAEQRELLRKAISALPEI